MKTLPKILLILVIIGAVFVISSIWIFPLFPQDTFSGIYSIINWILPVLVLILMLILIFEDENYQNKFNTYSQVRKFFSIVGYLILVAATIVVSWIIVTFIGFSNGSYSSSTYGTPIHRPKVK